MTALILSALSPYLLELIALALTLLIGWVAMRFTALTGIEIQARHRDALHSALMTGARAALSRGLPMQQAVEYAVGYAQSSVPGAIAKLRPPEPVMQQLARAKLQEASGRAGDR